MQDQQHPKAQRTSVGAVYVLEELKRSLEFLTTGFSGDPVRNGGSVGQNSSDRRNLFNKMMHKIQISIVEINFVVKYLNGTEIKKDIDKNYDLPKPRDLTTRFEIVFQKFKQHNSYAPLKIIESICLCKIMEHSLYKFSDAFL